jgi:hypothetical protein
VGLDLIAWSLGICCGSRGISFRRPRDMDIWYHIMFDLLVPLKELLAVYAVCEAAR